MNLLNKAAARLTLAWCALLVGPFNTPAAANPYFNPDKRHHTATGFRNNYVDKVTHSLPTVARWQWNAWRNNLPPKPQAPVPVVAPDLATLHAYASQRYDVLHLPDAPLLTWVGHATALVQAGGLNVLTDPMFSERAFPVQFAGPRRAQAPGVALADLPPIDVVLVSHNHLDHLDRASVVQLQALAKKRGGELHFLVPLGVKSLLLQWGVESVREFDWWESVSVHGTEFHFTPTQHWSARGLGDESETLWGAWAVFSDTLHWYFAGDTGYSQDFSDTRRHFAERHTEANGGGFDLALIPLGAYEPRWFMQGQHVNPAEALQVHIDIGSKRSVAVHWGTFALADEAIDQAPKDLQLALDKATSPKPDFQTLAIGETVRIPIRPR